MTPLVITEDSVHKHFTLQNFATVTNSIPSDDSDSAGQHDGDEFSPSDSSSCFVVTDTEGLAHGDIIIRGDAKEGRKTTFIGAPTS